MAPGILSKHCSRGKIICHKYKFYATEYNPFSNSSYDRMEEI